MMSFEKDEESLIPHEQEEEELLRNKKAANRPAMQIYRPPGLRSEPASSAASGSVHEKPNSSAGSKLNNVNQQRNEENNNKRERSEADSTSSRTSSRASGEEQNAQSQLCRTDSSLSGDSLSQKSGKSTTTTRRQNVLPVHVVKKEVKKRNMTEKEIEDAIIGLRSLNLTSHNAQIEQWIAGAFCDDRLAENIGSALCRHAIEGGGGREVAKLCCQFKDCPSVNLFISGVMTSLSQYFECRDGIRTEHFRMWISFIKFMTDFYSSLGSISPEDLSDVVFQVFNHLLRPPVLDSLKIEELECLISALLTIGYDLERDCPDQLALLKDLIRDAFVDATEPWARKMILLLLELGASNWKLPAEANDYYFHQANN